MQTQRGYSAVDLNYLRAALCKLNPSLWYYIWETSTSFISLFRQVLYDATLRSQISCTSQGSFAFSRSSMRIDCISTFWFFIESIVKEHSFKSKFLSVEVIGVNADPSASRSVSKHLVPLLPSDYSPSAGVCSKIFVQMLTHIPSASKNVTLLDNNKRAVPDRTRSTTCSSLFEVDCKGPSRILNATQSPIFPSTLKA